MASGKESDPVSLGNEAEWVTTDDYPASALRTGSFGTTTTQLTIGTDGRVQTCDIEASSGSIDLDNAACAALTTRARFEPARDRRHRAIVGTFRKRVRWSLPFVPRIELPRPEFSALGGMIVRFRVSQSLDVTECSVTLADRETTVEASERECARVAEQMRLPMGGNIPPQGLWVEIRNLVYSYDVDPGWDVSTRNSSDADMALRPPGDR